jgi:hypothetical protein
VLLQVMQQFTGMNVIMYYAPKIFELAGYTNTTQHVGDGHRRSDQRAGHLYRHRSGRPLGP